ncbi:MAG: dienelactone hydrolase family protein [Acidobacteria bacterium]|nr:dienelactone hydrolase family protein [Acidobacteriota bacterium]
MRLLLPVILLAAAAASAQDWAQKILEQSPRHGEWVTLKAGSRNVSAFVVYPEVKTKAPVVIVIHEIFGMTDWVRTVADKLAANGYIAIAPDLLSGFGPNGGRSSDFPSVDAAREAVGKLPPDSVTEALNAAADYGIKLPASNGKLAVAGFCWGGSQSFRFATSRADLKAAFVFYGTGPDDVSRITAPVYGFYAGNDARVDATIPQAQQAMQAAGKKYDPVTYEGAGHGFMRMGVDPSNTNPANKAACDQGWQRWLDLLRKM